MIPFKSKGDLNAWIGIRIMIRDPCVRHQVLHPLQREVSMYRNENIQVRIIAMQTESRRGTVTSMAARRNARTALHPFETASPDMSSPTDDLIPTRAHRLWELAGKPEGRDDEFWHEAERELKDGATNNPDEKSQTFLE